MSELQHLQGALAEATRLVHATWQQAVMGATRIPGLPDINININTRRLYADSIVIGTQINVPDANYLRRVVIATKQIAIDMEYGRGPFDMKPALLNGPKARIGKNGKRYNTVPFRHGTSGKYGMNSNFPTMPKDIYRQAKALKATLASRTSGRVFKYGDKLTGTEDRYGPKANKTTGHPHKNGYYEGMMRFASKGSVYMTFRRVSENSDPQSWWHPGYQAYHVAQHVSDYLKPSIEEMFHDAATLDLVDIPNMSVGMRVVRT